MKMLTKLFVFVVFVFSFVSCVVDDVDTEKRDELVKEVKMLQHQQGNLINSIMHLQEEKYNLSVEVGELRKCVKHGNEQVYLVTLELKQSTLSLSLSEYLKNEINSVEITIPTTKEFYYACKVGKDISKSFKAGSFFIDGDISNLHIKCVKKEIKYHNIKK